jgi:hypothetical protein
MMAACCKTKVKRQENVAVATKFDLRDHPSVHFDLVKAPGRTGDGVPEMLTMPTSQRPLLSTTTPCLLLGVLWALLAALTMTASGRSAPRSAALSWQDGRRAPQAEITNGIVKAQFYLPETQKGYYRGTRFDWSGVIGNLEYQGHSYFGPWFTKTDPAVSDFIYKGTDIIAGPCSAITGPVEEFSTDGKALGYDEAKPGETFVKIGVGVLRKPKDGGPYSPFRLYEIVDPGTWKVQTKDAWIEFTHELADPVSGFAYHYVKTIRLTKDRPEMVMDHTLKNNGKRPVTTSVYNHNFLVLDGQPPGPDFMLKVPFDIKTKRAPDKTLAEARGNQFVYLKALKDKESVYTEWQGFGASAADYRFTIENKKVGAGLQITGDRPLAKVVLWSIRTVLSVEPYVAMTLQPGQEFTWQYSYTFYVIDKKK